VFIDLELWPLYLALAFFLRFGVPWLIEWLAADVTRATHSPWSLLEAAAQALGRDFHAANAPDGAIRCVGTLASGHRTAIDLASREPAREHDVRLSVKLHGTFPAGEITDAQAQLPAEARRAIRHLDEYYALERLEIRDGELIAGRRWPAHQWHDWARALQLLGTLAHALEPQRHVELHANAQAQLRCAYCHGDLASDASAIVKCDRCGTALHEACREELGRCPVLGCESDGRARVH
jgi:hypothetical protein